MWRFFFRCLSDGMIFWHRLFSCWWINLQSPIVCCKWLWNSFQIWMTFTSWFFVLFLFVFLKRCGHCQRLTPEWKKAATALKVSLTFQLYLWKWIEVFGCFGIWIGNVEGFVPYNHYHFNHTCLARTVLFRHLKTQDFCSVWFVVSFLKEAVEL